MIDTFGLLGYSLSLMAIGIASGAAGKIRSLERKLNQSASAASDSVEIRNKLRDNLGRDVKFEFYEEEPAFAEMGNVNDENVVCRVVDLDDSFVEVRAVCPTKKKTYEGTFMIPIEDIRTVSVGKTEDEG